MNDGFPDRLTQLRGRWQSDPSSRVFLQLAEEYRHLGRLKEALEVLEAGLREHPGYLSALVAKGRCLLELGEAARARVVLERVVQQDATQMVANKMLVRAYLETGDAERARQKLDLYTLLNDRDPEIDELDRRVAAMSRPPLASDGPRPEEPAERPRMDSSLPPEEGLHPATPPSPSGSGARAAAGADVFDLGAPPPGAAAASRPPAAGSADVFDLSLPPHAAATPAAALPASAKSEASDGGDPFPGLHVPERRIRYLRALEAEGIFALGIGGEPAFEPEPAHTATSGPAHSAASEPAHTAASEPAHTDASGPAAAAEAAPEPAPAAEPEPVLAVAPELVPASVAASEPEPATGVPPEPESAPALAAAPAPEPAEAPATGATATLGFLYLRQGHLAEAEGIFREVVRREPDNSAAGEALAGLERRGRPLDAAHLLAGFEGGAEASGAARKTYLLNRYLSRLKAGPRHVS